MRVIIKNVDFSVYGIADISELLERVQSKLHGITDTAPIERFFRALGADGTSPIWSKIKRLYMPCLGIPTDGANALYDIIGGTNYPGNNFVIEAKRGVAPVTLGKNIGSDIIPDEINDSNLSFFCIVTQNSQLSISNSAAQVINIGGISCMLNNPPTVGIDETPGVSVPAVGGFSTPQPIVVSIPENGLRTIIGSAGISVSTDIAKQNDNFYLSGPRSYADTSLLAICSGITSSEVDTILNALKNLITDYGIVSANT